VLGVRKGVQGPQIEYQGRGDCEHVLVLEQWEVIGAIRPVYADEDEYEVDEDQVDFYSVKDLLEGALWERNAGLRVGAHESAKG